MSRYIRGKSIRRRSGSLTATRHGSRLWLFRAGLHRGAKGGVSGIQKTSYLHIRKVERRCGFVIPIFQAVLGQRALSVKMRQRQQVAERMLKFNAAEASQLRSPALPLAR
jgi:hypothetical protein